MRITTRVVAIGAATAVALTGLGVATTTLPASAATGSREGTGGTNAAERRAERVQEIEEVLAGLVTDGTITDDQAREVADALGSSDALRGGHEGPGRRGGWGGPGRWGGHGLGPLALDTAAEALGVTEQELRTALDEDGATLADVASTQGVDIQVLVDALVARPPHG